ncbi:MAG: UDP-N-acetylglucosamine--N-acetylmuramyl-(pentapeptide) pyrophosphoryl-undecaprenol N-acetylglucosamine transferase, partial [Candidatus Caldarchaeum sp.]
MRILITGGGTGGHVFPALEVARLAQKQGHQAVYFGSLRGQEAELAPKSGVAFEGFSMLPFVAFRLPSWVATLKAIRAVRRRLFTQKFDVVLSTGGYPGGAVLIAIQAFDVPVVFLEANAVPGKVHRLRMKNLMKVCVVFEEAIQYYAVPCERTGLPLREELVEAAQVPLPRQEKEFTTVC